MKALTLISLSVAALIFVGCDRDVQGSLLNQVKYLKQQNQQLDMQVSSLEGENRQLSGQVDTLSGLDAATRKAALPTIEKIGLAKRTGLVDKDNDGCREKLVVYLMPYDCNHDVFKAAGAVTIQLWDLEKTSGQAMLNEWEVCPEELGKLWQKGFTGSYYRFAFDIDTNKIKPDCQYTAKVTFTDYISGRVLSAQKAITAK